MSKVDPLTPINASYTGITKLNAHLDKIEAGFANTLSRDGSTPNEMNADIDMNSNQLINLENPTLGHHAATKDYVDNTVVALTGAYPRDEIYAVDFGVVADDSTDNTVALQAAFDAAAGKTLVLPKGTFRAGRITGNAPLTVVGVSAEETIWKRIANSNQFGVRFTSIDGVVLKRFKYDANIAQNTGSGSHGAVNFTTCSNMIVEDVTCVDCRGTFLGSPVGGGIGVNGGTGGVFTRVYAFNCYDGILFFNQHNFFRTDGCRVINNVRFGLLIDNCRDFVDNNTFAVLNGTDVTLDSGCSNILVQNSDGWVSNNAYCDSSPYGYGFQAQVGCDNFEINNCRATSNAWDGIGITGGGITQVTKGRVVGGMGVSNRLSNLAVNDDSQNISVIGFVDGGGSIEGINVFRSTAQIIGCQGNVTVWEASVINGISIGAAGSGYTDGTYTAVPLVGPTWYTDGTGRSALTADITVSGGAVTAVAINFQGWLALPPTSLTGLTAPSLPGGTGAQFTITLLGGSSNTCQGTAITNGNNGGTLRVQSGAVTTLPVYNSNFTTVSDPGGTIRSPLNLVNPRDFGVKADNVTNDTAAMQACIDASYGRKIYLPAGTIKVSNLTITGELELAGEGYTRTTISQITGSTGDLITINTSTSKHVVIRDLQVSGTAAGQDCIALTGTLTSGTQILDAFVSLAGRDGISIRSTADDNTVIRNTIVEVCRDGISFASGAVSGLVMGCRLNSNTRHSIYATGNTLGPGHRFIGNAIGGGVAGIHILNQNHCQISDNQIILQSTHGIWLKGAEQCSVVGNACRANTLDGIMLETGSQGSNYNTIADNVCSFNSRRGINLDTSPVGNTIRGNIITANGESGLRLYKAASNSIIGNQIFNNGITTSPKAGVYLADDGTGASSTNRIIGNYISDAGAGNQTTAIYNGATASNTVIVGNELVATTEVDIAGGNILHARDNIGWKTQNRGNSSIPNGATTVTINHGLDVTPEASDFNLMQSSGAPTNPSYLMGVTSITSTQFTVSANANPGASALAFEWAVSRWV
jgi:parallel beta-helix repeat protein